MEKAVLKIKKASPDVNPYAVASSTLQASGSLKKGTNEATKAGVKRGQKSSAWREQHPPRKAGGRLARAAGGLTDDELAPYAKEQTEDDTKAAQQDPQSYAAPSNLKKRGGRIEGAAKKPHLGRRR
jgi:hypothetical protein